MLKVWHVATHTTNIGDGALVKGIQRTIREDWPEPVEFISDCLMHYKNYWGPKQYTEKLIDQINGKSDLLLIGGGGMLDGGRRYSHTGMGFNLPIEFFKKIKIPIVFYAVGHNSFDGQYFWNKKKLHRLMDFIEKRDDSFFTVRNDGTIHRLKRLFGEPLAQVTEIPDPGMYVPVLNRNDVLVDRTKINVLIQLAGDNEFSRMSSALWRHVPIMGSKILNTRQSTFLGRIADAIQEVCVHNDINLTLCPHLLRDLSISDKFVKLLPTRFGRFNINMSEIVRGADQAAHFFGLYQAADLVIGMRGHSVICGVGLNTPTIAVASHKKVAGFMHSVGLDDRVIDINDRNLSQKLLSMIYTLINHQENERERLKKIQAQCRQKTREFHLEIYEKVKMHKYG